LGFIVPYAHRDIDGRLWPPATLKRLNLLASKCIASVSLAPKEKQSDIKMSNMEVEIVLSDFERSSFIEKHNFLFKQLNERVLSHFTDSNIENAAEEYGQELYDAMSRHASPCADPGDYAEQAIEEKMEYGLDLFEMRNHLVLVGLVYLYHHWEKTLRTFLERELRFYFERSNVEKQVWKTGNKPVFQILKDFGWIVEDQGFYIDLDTVRLTVNVFKHGKGTSFELLKKRAPQFFRTYDPEIEDDPFWNFLDHTNLEIDSNEFDKLTQSIELFWQTFPQRLSLGRYA